LSTKFVYGKAVEFTSLLINNYIDLLIGNMV